MVIAFIGIFFHPHFQGIGQRDVYKRQDELIDYAMRSGAPLEVLENLQEIEDEGDAYDSIEDLWPDYPSKDDFLWNDDEY